MESGGRHRAHSLPHTWHAAGSCTHATAHNCTHTVCHKVLHACHSDSAVCFTQHSVYACIHKLPSTVARVTLAVTRAAGLQTLLLACQGGPSRHSEALGSGGGQHGPETTMIHSRWTATALHVER